MLQLLEHPVFSDHGDNLDWFGPQVNINLASLRSVAHHDFIHKSTESVGILRIYSLLQRGFASVCLEHHGGGKHASNAHTYTQCRSGRFPNFFSTKLLTLT